MIRSLHLKNILLVQTLTIDFESGFNVLTGETGAGKSLIVRSLSLLSGQPASDAIIHPDHDTAAIDGVFCIPDTLDIPDEFRDNGQLIVSRRIHRSRPTINKINHELVSLKTLKHVMSMVLVVVAQNQVMQLLSDTNHRAMLDRALPSEGQRIQSQYGTAFDDYKAQYDLYETQRATQDDMQQTVDDLTILIEDVDEVSPVRGEDDALHRDQTQCHAIQDRKQQLMALQALVNTTTDALIELDNRVGQYATTGETAIDLDSQGAIAQLQTLSHRFAQDQLDIEYLETLDLDAINARLNTLFKLKVKYNASTVDALLDQYDAAITQRDTLQSALADANTLKQAVDDRYRVLMERGQALSRCRHELIPSFESNVMSILAHLAMPDAVFSVSMNTVSTPTRNGLDDVSFLFSANPTLPPAPLKKVASGGELSRVMLALMVGHPVALPYPLLVFDEVDVGVGGITANYIGDVLAQLSERHQLLVVTHLPQIARCASAHYKIKKDTAHDSTTAITVERIARCDVADEIERMVGGDIISSMIK